MQETRKYLAGLEHHDVAPAAVSCIGDAGVDRSGVGCRGAVAEAQVRAVAGGRTSQRGSVVFATGAGGVEGVHAAAADRHTHRGTARPIVERDRTPVAQILADRPPVFGCFFASREGHERILAAVEFGRIDPRGIGGRIGAATVDRAVVVATAGEQNQHEALGHVTDAHGPILGEVAPR
jgi:hypothetical protein